MATATTAKKKDKKKAPVVGVTVATFDARADSPVFRVVRAKPLDGFGAIERNSYTPDTAFGGVVGGEGSTHGGGATPLRDATMAMIHHLDGVRSKKTIQIGLLLDESGSMAFNRDAVIDGTNEFIGGLVGVDASEPGRVLCVIFTDGHENASRNVSPEDLRQAVSEREADGWTFIFMGANMDAWAEASANLGVSGGVSGQTVNYTSSPIGTQSAMRETSRRAGAFVQSDVAYAAYASAKGNNSVVPENDDPFAAAVPVASPSIPKPGGPKKPKPKPGYNAESIGDALKKARDSM